MDFDTWLMHQGKVGHDEPAEPVQWLPDNINQLADGSYEAKCCCCGRWGELYCDISELDLDEEVYKHYCGGSPWCCP